MNNMKRNACQKCVFAVRDDNPHCGLRGFTTSFNVEWCESENDKAPNGYELQEDGYFSWVEKKKKYPKTYTECLSVLGIYNGLPDVEIYNAKPSECILFESLIRLKRCLDAYYQIAGQEMGLGKPWEPDWGNDNHESYPAIVACGGKIIKSSIYTHDNPFAFPTEEMRDAFYENFKGLIEICKLLL